MCQRPQDERNYQYTISFLYVLFICKLFQKMQDYTLLVHFHWGIAVLF